MSWKMVRDHTEAVAIRQGVSGRWRKCRTPISSLTKKLFEEAGEYVENMDAAELYDLLDVLTALIPLADPDGKAAAEHDKKLLEMGGFSLLIEWSPVPASRKDLTS